MPSCDALDGTDPKLLECLLDRFIESRGWLNVNEIRWECGPDGWVISAG